MESSTMSYSYDMYQKYQPITLLYPFLRIKQYIIVFHVFQNNE